MNPDFDRLFRLAKKTGDTLIVLDAESGNHHVIMDIDKYEDLVMDQDLFLDSLDSEESEIGPFGDQDLERAQASAGHVVPEQRDSFTQKDKPWHAAGDVLDNLYPEFNVAPNTSEDTLANAIFNTDEDIKLNFEPVGSFEEPPAFEPIEGASGPFASSAQEPFAPSVPTQGMTEQNVESGVASIEYDPIMQEPQPIPPAEEGEMETDVYDEENLGEDPIFFEEPLN